MDRSVPNPLASDLHYFLECTSALWEEFRGQRVFITGGTGFVGCWLLESFTWANDKLGLNAEALVLTRNYRAFLQKVPHLATHPAIKFQEGELGTFAFPGGRFSCIIHAATETNVRLDNPSPLTMFMSSVDGTRRVLDFARECRAEKFLFVSSGAVYGKQPADLLLVPEDYTGAPALDDLNSAYAHGKRAAEFMALAYAEQHGFSVKIARCFAFVGPYLPLDSGFAIGNFIGDVLSGKPVQVKGDGTPCRSYLYAADLAVWLWTILIKGAAGRAYNVGSENYLSIRELTEVFAEVTPGVDVRIAKTAVAGALAERYVPATKRARLELGLRDSVQLPEAIERTLNWHRCVA